MTQVLEAAPARRTPGAGAARAVTTGQGAVSGACRRGRHTRRAAPAIPPHVALVLGLCASIAAADGPEPAARPSTAALDLNYQTATGRLSLTATGQPLGAVGAALEAAAPVRIRLLKPSLSAIPVRARILDQRLHRAIAELLGGFDWVAAGSDGDSRSSYRVLVLAAVDRTPDFPSTLPAAGSHARPDADPIPTGARGMSPHEALRALEARRFATAEQAGRWAASAAEADAPAVHALLGDWSRSGDARAQRVAAVGLGEVGGATAVTMLAALLGDPGADRLARHIAANSLTRIDTDAAFDALERAFSGGDARQRRAVVTALARGAGDDTLVRAAPWLGGADLTTDQLRRLIRRLASMPD